MKYLFYKITEKVIILIFFKWWRLLFKSRGNTVSALALTSTATEDLLAIGHTPDDNLGIVDKEKLVVISKALKNLILI